MWQPLRLGWVHRHPNLFFHLFLNYKLALTFVKVKHTSCQDIHTTKEKYKFINILKSVLCFKLFVNIFILSE